MSEYKPSAFPLPIAVGSAGDLYDASQADPGMTLWDYYAAASMQGYCANPSYDWTSEEIAKHAGKDADAMMKARGEKCP